VAKTKAAKIYAKFNIYLMPLITALAVFLIVSSLTLMASNENVRAGARDVGPQSNLLIPGLNPYLPWTYGWLSLVITIIIHEAGHGIIARVYNVKVESTGIVLLLGLPIGAFVNIGREELQQTSLKQKSAILTAGPLSNMLLTLISVGFLYLIISSLTPLPADANTITGVTIMSINKNSLAESIGLQVKDTVTNINGQEIKNIGDLGSVLQSNLGKNVRITWITESKQSINKELTLPINVDPNRGILGVTITNASPDPSFTLERYKEAFYSNPLILLIPPTLNQGMVPYSDSMAGMYTSSFGEYYAIYANIFFWLIFINFNVGIFNALPMGPLDGGQFYNAIIEKKAKVRKELLKSILSYGMLAIVAAAILLPWIEQLFK
jgi:membrane-associated protease RseP (regulator of RpoE activity)